MSDRNTEKLSGDIPPPPEFRGDMREWARELSIYIEQQLRSHNSDIQNLYELKISAAFSGDYSAAWPAKRINNTDFQNVDTGKFAIDTKSTPNRVAVYVYGTGWVEIGS